MKKITLGLFILILSSSIIIATPPSGNYPIGTSWCENSATSGTQMYTYESGGWAGPYSCPGGCTSLGTGGHCAAPKSCSGGTVGTVGTSTGFKSGSIGSDLAYYGGDEGCLAV